MRNKHLIITLLLIGIVEFVGTRIFDNSRYEYWFKPIYFLLIVFNFILGYHYWKTRVYDWLKVFWACLYSFVLFYFLVYWTLDYFGYYHTKFIYKSYLQIGLTPLTFGLFYLIEFAVINNDESRKR